MKKIYVTSDLHFYHNNIIKYCNRPFSSVEDMNEKLINNWNSIVKPEDDVYIIGDFAMTSDIDKLRKVSCRLFGKKHLIFGNHDYFTDEQYLQNGFETVNHGIFELYYECRTIVMCHYQMVSWDESFKGSMHLFGHSHWTKQDPPDHEIFKKMGWSERSYNVCVDCNNYIPIELNAVTKILSNRQINNSQ